MFEELLKDGLKKALENGVFVVFLIWLAYDMKQDQKQMVIASELRRQKGEKVLIETIEKVAKQRDQKIEELIDCYNSRLRDNNDD
jgi:hypothetical protein